MEHVAALAFFAQDAKVRKAAQAVVVAGAPGPVASRVTSDSRNYSKMGPAKMPKAVAELAGAMQLPVGAFAVAVGEVITASLTGTSMTPVKDTIGGAIATLNTHAPAALPDLFGRLPAYTMLVLDDIKETVPNGLARLTSVQELYFNSWDVKSYAGEFRGATSAHFARFVMLRAKNAGFLSDLTGLRTLCLDNSILPDLAPLATLVQLEDLRLEVVEGFNEWSSVKKPLSLAPLAGLSRLRVLHLSTARFASLAGIESLTGLEELALSYVSATDLTPLAALPRLRKLTIHRVAATDGAPLARIPSLTSLAVSGCPDLSLAGVARDGLQVTVA